MIMVLFDIGGKMETNVNIESVRKTLHNRLMKGEPDSFNRSFPNGANVGDTLVLFELSLVVVPKATRESIFPILKDTKVKNITDIEGYHGDVKDLIYFFADGQAKGLEPNDDVLTDAIISFAALHDLDNASTEDRGQR